MYKASSSKLIPVCHPCSFMPLSLVRFMSLLLEIFYATEFGTTYVTAFRNTLCHLSLVRFYITQFGTILCRNVWFSFSHRVMIMCYCLPAIIGRRLFMRTGRHVSTLKPLCCREIIGQKPAIL